MSFPTLLHSVSYSGSWGQDLLSVDDFVRKSAALGFNGVMLMAKRPHLSILDFDAQARAGLKKLIRQNGLTKVCLAGYSNFTSPQIWSTPKSRCARCRSPTSPNSPDSPTTSAAI